MITTNTRTKDPEDVGLLFHSILRYGEANAERLDLSIMAIGYATLMQHADQAAQALAELHEDVGPEWDGCVWLERLEDGASPVELGEGALDFCRRLAKSGLLEPVD